MADLIERDAIEEVAHNVFEEEDALYYYNALHSIAKIVQAICEAPAVDAEPVQHGRWVFDYDEYYGENFTRCSKCKSEFVNEVDGWRGYEFCPHCGAKMDGGTNDA